MCKRMKKVVSLTVICTMLTILLASGTALMATPVKTIPKTQTDSPTLVKPEIPMKPPIDRRTLLLPDLAIDWIRLNKDIVEGDRVGDSSVFNISVKSDIAPARAVKVKMTFAALSGGPAPAEASGVKDCPALAKAGSFAFTWPAASNTTWKAGSYRLTVEADSDKIQEEADEQNNTKTFDFTVLPCPSVKVTDNTGKPLAATVSAFSGTTPVQSHPTNAQGMAYFPGLAAATYKFLATADGYAAATVTAAVPSASGIAITLPKSEAKGQALIGVRDASNAPVSGATVSVTVAGVLKTQTTDANGGAQFSDLPTGPATFTAAKTGYVSAATTVTILANVTANGVIQLPSPASMAIITVNDGVRPLFGITVKAITPNRPDRIEVTNSQGQASFANLPPANYLFWVIHPGYTPNSVSMTINSNVTVNGSVSLVRETGNIDILVAQASPYTPLEGATVNATLNGVTRTLVTNAQGMVSFTALPTGNYTFTAAKGGYNTNSIQVNLYNGNFLGGKAIELTKETGSISVTVTDGANPIDLADVSVISLSGQGKSQKTNAQGVTTISGLLPGQYSVSAYKYGYNTNRVMATIAPNSTASTSVALTKQPGTTSANIKVRDYFTNPISDASVNVQGNGVSQNQNTNGQGEAAFSNLPFGSYTITVVKSGYKNVSVNIPALAGDVYITLAAL